MSTRTNITSDNLEQLRQTIQPFTKGFDLLTDHVIITDLHGNIVYANKAAERATGYSVEEMLGKNPGDLWGGHMPAELYEDLWHTIKDLKKSWHGWITNHRKDGATYTVASRINPVLDKNNNCCFFVAIEPTIDTSKLSNDDLQNAIIAKTRLFDFYSGKSLEQESLNKAIDEFVEEFHESKNP